MEERELVARALAGDAEAERAIYEAHVDRIYRLAYRMAGDRDLAEEFTQDTFVRAFDRLASFRGEAALSSWIHAIGVSVILNGLRGLTRRRSREIGWEAMSQRGDPSGDDDAELKRKVGRAIDSLPDELRLVFVMHEMEGYKHREIAAILGLPEGTSKARLLRARQHLRNAITGDPMHGLQRLEPRAET